MAVFCENCGAQLREGAKFCPGCGTAAPAETPPQQQQQVYTPPPPQQQYYAPPPQQVYAAPPPQQVYAAPPPQKKKFPIWLLIVIIAAAAVAVFVIIGLTQDSTEDLDYTEEEIAYDEDDFVYPVDEDDPVIEEDEPEFVYTETENDNPTTFDFATLSEAKFPRGVWSVNELTDIYGPPEEAYAYYLPGYEIAFIRVTYGDLVINFMPRVTDVFSFYSNNLEEGEYELNESDKDLELEILSLRSYDPNALPNGITIGKSTKAQVVAAYGENPYYIFNDWDYETDMFSYQYAFADDSGAVPQDLEFYDLGAVSYFFDRDGVLEFVIVEWIFYDL